MTQQKVIDLLQKYEDGTCSSEERAKLESWYNQHSRAQADMPFPEDFWARKEAGLQSIFQDSTQVQPKIFSLRRYSWFIAAAVLLIINAGIWFFSSNNLGDKVEHNVTKNSAEILPGRNIATLKFTGGKVINLSDAQTGVVVDGQSFTYEDGTRVAAEVLKADQEVIASTPRGGTYQVTLSDGSKVWLNAASSLKFPATFDGLQRRTVELTGEAYFIISRDEAHPFIVQSKGQEVQVLGTQFNINSYTDELDVKTTLVKGSLKISALKANNGGVILSPNQQAILTPSNRIEVKKVDVGNEIGWKNGDFVFDGEDFKSTMRKIERWYNVNVQYEPSVSSIDSLNLDGWVSRNSDLSDVLKQIESTGNVHFKIKGRTVIVMK